MLSRQGETWLHELFPFLVECWGLDLEEKPHRSMVNVIQDTELDDEITNSMLIVPRGTYKCQSTQEYRELSGRLASETGTADNGPNEVFRVTLRCGRSMDVTSNHPFRTWRGWRSVDEGLSAGDWVGIVRKGQFGAAHEPDLAELVGWMLADAHLPAQVITAYDSLERKRAIALAVSAGFEAVERADGESVSVHKMQPLWREWGLFGARSADKFVPQRFLRADEETTRALLRGLVGHDGYNPKAGRQVVYVTISRRLARDVQHLLTKFGTWSSLSTLENTGGKYAGMPAGYVWYTVTFTDSAGILGPAPALEQPPTTDVFPPEWRDELPMGVGLKLRNAGVRIDNAYATTRAKVRRVAVALDLPWLLEKADANVAWDRVASIEPLGMLPTIAVEAPDGVLIAGDIVTHNTSITRGSIVWKLLRQIHLWNNPYHRIAVASATLALGKEILGGIEGGLRGGVAARRIADVFGPLWQERTKTMPGSKREDGIVLAPRIWQGEIASVLEPNIWIASVRRVTTGFHADELIIDDLNNRDNTKTDHQRSEVHKYWAMLFPIVGSKDRVGRRTKKHVNATPYHDDDVRGRIVRTEAQRLEEDPDYKSTWRVLHQGAILEDGTAFFPGKLDLDVLERLKNDPSMDPATFASQYLCDPVGEDGFVNNDEIVFRSRRDFPALRHGRITVDPNQHKDAIALGCYAAMVVSGYDRWANLYVLDLRGSRKWNTGEFIDALFEAQEDYPDFPIFMEDSHMAHFQHAIQLEEARRSDAATKEDGQSVRIRLRVNYVPTDVAASKYERWTRIRPRFKNHSIYFADEIGPSFKVEMREELVRGRASRFKDFLDALAMAETGVRPKVAKDGAQVELSQPGGYADEPKTKENVLTFADVLNMKKRGYVR